jgi:peptidoglycan-associated lipoprotein
MRNAYWLRIVCLSFLIVAAATTGCKKRVAAAPPPAPPVQPAPPPTPAPTITLRATPASIDRGQATSLQWEARNATAVRIEPEVGGVANQGSRSVSPASSVTYTAIATGPGGSASDVARITVRVPAAAVPTRPEPRPDTKVSLEEIFRQNVQTIYFDYDKADIRPDQVSQLEANASWLKQNRGVKFTIEGHCDDRGSAEYNIGLGDRRANSVKEFLIKQGVDPSNIKTISYGEERPVCTEETEQCYQRNRRAAFVPSPTS